MFFNFPKKNFKFEQIIDLSAAPKCENGCIHLNGSQTNMETPFSKFSMEEMKSFTN